VIVTPIKNADFGKLIRGIPKTHFLHVVSLLLLKEEKEGSACGFTKKTFHKSRNVRE